MSPATTFEDLVHLTWRGRVSWAWYAIRRVFLRPAPEGDRCIMGYPIGEYVRCPRRIADDDGLWCDHHRPRRVA